MTLKNININNVSDFKLLILNKYKSIIEYNTLVHSLNHVIKIIDLLNNDALNVNDKSLGILNYYETIIIGPDFSKSNPIGSIHILKDNLEFVIDKTEILNNYVIRFITINNELIEKPNMELESNF